MLMLFVGCGVSVTGRYVYVVVVSRLRVYVCSARGPAREEKEVTHAGHMAVRIPGVPHNILAHT